MKKQNIIVVGGGHTGLMLINQIQQQIIKPSAGKYSLILVEQESFHTRKTILFKEISNSAQVKIPLSAYGINNYQVIQAKLVEIDGKNNLVSLQDSDGKIEKLDYARLILALGNVIREVPPEKGGFLLRNVEDAQKIRKHILANIVQAKMEPDLLKRKKLLTLSVIGAGLSGIETAAELCCWLKKELHDNTLQELLEVNLFNSGSRLLPFAPEKVGNKLEKELGRLGITVYHNTKVLQYSNNNVYIEKYPPIFSSTCIWMIGTQANPDTKRFGFKLKENGKFIIDTTYHVQGHSNIYSIGDCAHVFDPKTGRVDEMTCKESGFQAVQLCKIIKTELNGKTGSPHKQPAFTLYCIALGLDNALVWLNLFSLDIVLQGKLAVKIRNWTWDSASIMSKIKTHGVYN